MWQKAKDGSCENSREHGYTLLPQHKADNGDEERRNPHDACRQSIHAVNPIDRIHHTDGPKPGEQDSRDGRKTYSTVLDEQEEGRFTIPGQTSLVGLYSEGIIKGKQEHALKYPIVRPKDNNHCDSLNDEFCQPL